MLIPVSLTSLSLSHPPQPGSAVSEAVRKCQFNLTFCHLFVTPCCGVPLNNLLALTFLPFSHSFLSLSIHFSFTQRYSPVRCGTASPRSSWHPHSPYSIGVQGQPWRCWLLGTLHLTTLYPLGRDTFSSRATSAPPCLMCGRGEGTKQRERWADRPGCSL